MQALYRRLIDRDLLAHNPATRLDLPTKGNARPKRIVSGAEAAALLEPLSDDDRPLWAAAFYAGLRRGELQALRCRNVDLGASLIRVERGWDQYEGEIEPKSKADRRTVPLLALLRDHVDEHLLRTGRSGDDLVYGRTAAHPFVPSMIGDSAQERWAAAEFETITLHEARHTFALVADRLRSKREGRAGVHGALEDPDHLRYLWAPAPGQPRRGSRADGRLPRCRRAQEG